MHHPSSFNNENLNLFSKLVASHTTINDGALQIDKSSVLSELLHNPLFVAHNPNTNPTADQIYQNKLALSKRALKELSQQSFPKYFLGGGNDKALLSANIEQTVLSPFEFRPVNDSNKKGFFLQFQHTLLKVETHYEHCELSNYDDGANENPLASFYDIPRPKKDFNSVQLNVRFPSFLLQSPYYKSQGFKGALPFYKKDELTADDFTRENVDDTHYLIDCDLYQHARGLRYANQSYSSVNSRQLLLDTNLYLNNSYHENDDGENSTPYKNSHPVLYSVAMYEHKDTGRISLLVGKRNYYLHRKTHELKISPIFCDRLTYNPNDGSLTLKRNNRSVYGRALNKALSECGEVLRLVSNNDLWYHQEMDTIMSLCGYGDYLLSRSPLKTLLKSNVSAGCLKSLYAVGNESIDKELSLQRKRVLYHLKKGNTHKAINSCLHDIHFPKTMRQSLLSSDILLRKDQLDLISQVIDTIGIDNTYHLLFSNYDNGHFKDYSEHPLVGIEYLKLITLGFSAKKITNYKAKSFYYASDINRMYDLLVNDDFFNDVELKKPSHIKSVQDYHDYLMKFSQIQQQNRLEQYREPHVSKFDSMIDEKNGFIVRPVKTTAELVGIGAQMNHCVGSYTELHFMKGCEIIVITPIADEQKYLACISLDLGSKGCHLEQAKLPYNAPVKENPELTQLTIDWLNAQKQTIDFKSNYDLY